ncbi:MAG: type II TA system antitoxin MqsA family protein [Candidatus Eiseniibacteriota bacterium]
MKRIGEDARACLECGTRMESTREDYVYEPVAGLRVLLQKVQVARCSECRTLVPAIPKIAQLHRVIASSLVQKATSLAPPEIRYLRKHLGFSGEEFAHRMGVRRESVSRWETGKEPMGPVADRLLRLMVVTQEPVAEYALDRLAQIKRVAKAARLTMLEGETGWELVAA